MKTYAVPVRFNGYIYYSVNADTLESIDWDVKAPVNCFDIETENPNDKKG